MCYSLWCNAPTMLPAGLDVQHNNPPFPKVSDHWLPVSIPIVFKYSTTSFLHLSRGLPVSPYSLQCSRYKLFWHSLVLHSSSMTTPSQSEGGEISPTRCNNCVFFIHNGFTLHVSGDNLTHHQEYNAVYGHR